MLRPLSRRPRLSASLLLMVAVYGLLPAHWLPEVITRVLVGWNAGLLTYLALTARLMVKESHEDIRRRAPSQDEGAATILVLVIAGALFSLGGIVMQLGLARHSHGLDKLMHVGLVVLTISTTWFFTQLMFALHYAHDFYLDRDRGGSGGLAFPGEGAEDPGYFDFLYVAGVIGVASQTADVSFTTRKMRRVGLVHGVLAFVFNTALVALMINVASSMI